MKLEEADLKSLCRIAEEAAQQAGQLINSYRNKPFTRLLKEGGNTLASQVVTEVDYRCEAFILEQLKNSLEKYDLAVLSEEQEDDKQRLSKDYFWCIDPMDGTLAFTESKPGYAVSIALVAKDGTPCIGVVYDPVNATLYSAIKDQGAFRNNTAWALNQPTKSTSLTLPCDRSLLEQTAFSEIRNTLQEWATQQGYRELSEIHHGGAVMNACWVLENPPACYFKLPKPELGGGCFWDFAATACIYKEMGATVCNFKGQDLDLNRAESSYMNHQGVIFTTDLQSNSNAVGNTHMLQLIQSFQATQSTS